jgi:hypothetical protein
MNKIVRKIDAATIGRNGIEKNSRLFQRDLLFLLGAAHQQKNCDKNSK